MFSTKISTHVSFPLEGLDLQPFLAKDSPVQIVTYDLLSVICHHGTASSKYPSLTYDFTLKKETSELISQTSPD